MEKNVPLGIAISLCGTLCSAVGYTLQKLAHHRADRAGLIDRVVAEVPVSRDVAEPAGVLAVSAAPPAEILDSNDETATARRPTVPYHKYWQFPAGIAMLVLGSLTAIISFGLAGQAQLAPMSAVTLLWNELLAWKASATLRMSA